jgi:hypothetical protein
MHRTYLAASKQGGWYQRHAHIASLVKFTTIPTTVPSKHRTYGAASIIEQALQKVFHNGKCLLRIPRRQRHAIYAVPFRNPIEVTLGIWLNLRA